MCQKGFFSTPRLSDLELLWDASCFFPSLWCLKSGGTIVTAPGRRVAQAQGFPTSSWSTSVIVTISVSRSAFSLSRNARVNQGEIFWGLGESGGLARGWWVESVFCSSKVPSTVPRLSMYGIFTVAPLTPLQPPQLINIQSHGVFGVEWILSKRRNRTRVLTW